MRTNFLDNIISFLGGVIAIGAATTISDTSTETASGCQGILNSSTETNQVMGTTDMCAENPLTSSSAAGLIASGSYSASTSADSGPDIEGDIGGIKFKGYFRDTVPYTKIEKRAQKVYQSLHQQKLSVQKPVFISRNKETSHYMQEVFGTQNKHIDYETLIILERFLEEFTNE